MTEQPDKYVWQPDDIVITKRATRDIGDELDVREHGETGPTLTRKGDDFRDAKDVAKDQ